MEKEKFESAKLIREQITVLERQKVSIEKLRERTDDEDFNQMRKCAHDVTCLLIQTLEEEFKQL